MLNLKKTALLCSLLFCEALQPSTLKASEACQQAMKQISVIFSNEMIAASGNEVSQSSSKPGMLIEALKSGQYNFRIVPVNPVSAADLKTVHEAEYVDGVLSSQMFNAFGNKSKEVASSLPFTSGSLHKASEIALEEGLACSPSSGFHHAGFASAESFCTFNGLIVTAVKLLNEKKVKKIAIIDADNHPGNGTDSLLDKLKLRDRVYHYSFGYHFRNPSEAQSYLDKLESLRTNLADFKPDLIIYQAGADVHVQDPLGGVLTTMQMLQRDEKMFEIAKALSIPIVWNLAGGYQEDSTGTIKPVIDLHLLTFHAASRVYGIPLKKLSDETLQH